MADDTISRQRPRFWITVVAVIILLIFLYFYQPFESYVVAHIPEIHFSNVIFWFACLVGVVGYAMAHWQSFRQEIFSSSGDLNVENLVFDTLQISILIAVVFFAGATLQAVEMLGEHLVNRGPIIDASFGKKLLAIVVLVILAILCYLMHYVVHGFRAGWPGRRSPPRRRARSSAD